jgi:hypothetical protein
MLYIPHEVNISPAPPPPPPIAVVHAQKYSYMFRALTYFHFPEGDYL